MYPFVSCELKYELLDICVTLLKDKLLLFIIYQYQINVDQFKRERGRVCIQNFNQKKTNYIILIISFQQLGISDFLSFFLWFKEINSKWSLINQRNTTKTRKTCFVAWSDLELSSVYCTPVVKSAESFIFLSVWNIGICCVYTLSIWTTSIFNGDAAEGVGN